MRSIFLGHLAWLLLTSSAFVPSSFAAKASDLPLEAQVAIDESDLSLETSEHSTSVRSVAIWVRASAAAAKQLCSILEQEINLKSYLEAKCIEDSADRDPAAKELARKLKVDGILEVAKAEGQLRLRLFNSRGAVLQTWALASPESKVNQEILAQAVDKMVNEFPYRGFVTKRTESAVQINLGSKHRIQRGQRLKLFRFTGTDFQSARKDTGVVHVIAVLGDDKSLANMATGAGTIELYDKVDFEKVPASHRVATTRVSEAGWMALGGEFLASQVDVPEREQEGRSYRHDATPFLSLAAGKGPISVEVRSGKGKSTGYDIAYSEFRAGVEFYEWGNDRRGGFIAGGIWTGQYALQNSRLGLNKRDAQSFGPIIDGRYQILWGEKALVFVGGEFFYPIFSSDQVSGTQPVSWGVGGLAGVRFDIGVNWALELGARARYQRIALAGIAGSVAEQQNGPFLRALYFF